jgi:hypothetical protein
MLIALYHWIIQLFWPSEGKERYKTPKRKTIYADAEQSPILPLSGDLSRLADYLAKMLPEDRLNRIILLDNLPPSSVIYLNPEQMLDAFLDHVRGKGISIKFPDIPSSVYWLENDTQNLAVLELSTENRLIIRLHKDLTKDSAALGSIIAMELSRFLIEHNEINYSIHSAENLLLPDVAMHILGLSDVFLHGWEEANRVWPQYFKRPIFSRLRLQQHRSLANYIDHLEETFVSRNNQSLHMTVEEMERQLFQYMGKNRDALEREFERNQKANPHLSKKEIYEKMLYDWKREFRI